MPAPLPLRALRELRWALAPGPGLLSPFEAAGVALDALRQLAALQPAADARGAPLQPPPRAHVALAAPDCLPHIAQVPGRGAGRGGAERARHRLPAGILLAGLPAGTMLVPHFKRAPCRRRHACPVLQARAA
jgi:hypothetical protein